MEENAMTKVYCCDRDRGSDALAYAAMANNRGNDPMAMMAAMNNQWDNPFVYLVWMMFAQRMWGNNGENLQNTAIQSQIDSLRTQMSDNHNSDLLMSAVNGNGQDLKTLAANLNCDFNQLQTAVCSVRSAIDQVAGQVGFSAERVINAVNAGDCSVIQAIKDCCCQTQQNIIRMGFVNRGVERGFSSVAFQAQQDKCDVIRAGQDNTQRVIDTLNLHWQQELQQRYNDARLELSQQRQNAQLIAALKTTGTTTA